VQRFKKQFKDPIYYISKQLKDPKYIIFFIIIIYHGFICHIWKKKDEARTTNPTREI
jgi:hypothetical protein